MFSKMIYEKDFVITTLILIEKIDVMVMSLLLRLNLTMCFLGI